MWKVTGDAYLTVAASGSAVFWFPAYAFTAEQLVVAPMRVQKCAAWLT